MTARARAAISDVSCGSLGLPFSGSASGVDSPAARSHPPRQRCVSRQGGTDDAQAGPVEVGPPVQRRSVAFPGAA
jgi:hypothetical protein